MHLQNKGLCCAIHSAWSDTAQHNSEPPSHGPEGPSAPPGQDDRLDSGLGDQSKSLQADRGLTFLSSTRGSNAPPPPGAELGEEETVAAAHHGWRINIHLLRIIVADSGNYRGWGPGMNVAQSLPAER